MDDLTPVSTTYLKQPTIQATPPPACHSPQTVSTPQQALEALRAQPDYDQLLLILQYLASPGTESPSIWTPSPESAQIVSLLVGEIAENYWTLLREAHTPHESPANLFLSCLLSVAGLNALVAKLRALVAEAKGVGRNGPVRSSICADISLYLDLLVTLLCPSDTLETLWDNTVGRTTLGEPLKKQLLGEILALIAGGKVLSTAAEAAHAVHVREGRGKTWWAADGAGFSKWIGRNVASWAKKNEDEGRRLAGMVWVRGLRLGHADVLSKTVIDALLLTKCAPSSAFSDLLSTVPALDEKKILNILVSHLSSLFLTQIPQNDATSHEWRISAVAGLIKRAVNGDAARKSCLVGWLTSSTGAGLGEGIAVRRTVVAAIGENKDDVLGIVEGALALFGDELYIRHSPALQQEAHAQVLLLAVGQLNRLAPLKLMALVKTGGYLSTISNRIAASQTRSRFLGMVVGEALSKLVNGECTRLKFGLPELDTEEAAWWRGLVDVDDRPGDVNGLLMEEEYPQIETLTTNSVLAPKEEATTIKPSITAPIANAKPKPMVQVVDSDSDAKDDDDDDSDDDNDLKPYAKPAFDPHDSDDDPTLIRRNRPQPPVYIRTLLTYLRAHDDLDKQTLALRHGPRLIRSKAHHGTEVSAHAAELASQFINLTDNFDMEGFLDMRLRCLVALVVAVPREIGPWMARTLWEGDLSVSQRVSLMIALGLGGREVAGLQQPDEGEATNWVGERLPDRIGRLYLDKGPMETRHKEASSLKPMGRNALDMATVGITTGFLAPLAAKAADDTTGPDSLKLTSFTSRLTKSKSTTGSKIRAIPNTTSALLYGSFFSPLHARLTYSLSHAQPVMHEPSILTAYIKTLGLLVHAAGPSTLSLPQMTAELWDLLLAVRSRRPGDMGVTGAILGALVALLEVNDVHGPGGWRICADFGRQVVESREWTAMVFGQIRGEGDHEESEVKMLAAGVLVRLDEVLEKHQLLLVGGMVM